MSLRKKITLDFVKTILKSLQSPHPFIQVVMGPRQVGKTTGVLQLLKKIKSHHYASADGDLIKPAEWILEQWDIAKSKSKSCLLVMDEIQKIESWSEILKKLWDEQKIKGDPLKVLVLGSSSLSLHKGLSESLAGRYQLHKVYHWNPHESLKAYGLSLRDFLMCGGYPGSYPLISEPLAWLNYMRSSIIEPVIAKDILQQARVKSPALFKQCFDIACSYPAQEISYTKLLGQLQDKGNVELVKHYLNLFENAFLLKQLYKFTAKPRLTKSSSPKILPLCPALYTVGLDLDLDSEELGRSFEVMIGSMLNRLPGQLYYWREANAEVDYVYKFGKRLYALEVKYGNKKTAKGLLKFKEKFPQATTFILTPENYQNVFAKIG